MTNAQRIQIELSQKRAQLATFAAGADGDGAGGLTAEEARAITVEVGELETRRAAAIAADPQREVVEPQEDGEDRELRELTDKARVSDVFGAAVDHGHTDGATKELQEHFGLGANQVPLSLFAEGPDETRAVTAAPANVGRRQAPILAGVFPQSVAAFLGVDMPTVAAGQATYPVLKVNAVVRVPAESGTAAETDGEFTAKNLSPARLQAAFRYTREDAASFAGMDPALRENLRMALADGLDKQVISGTNGLLTGTNLSNNNVSAVTTFDLYRSGLAYSRVDGIYAGGVADLRIVMGAGTYAHAASQFRGNNSSVSALENAASRDRRHPRISPRPSRLE